MKAFILPTKLTGSKLKTDLSDFARRLRLKGYFYGKESSEYDNPFITHSNVKAHGLETKTENLHQTFSYILSPKTY